MLKISPLIAIKIEAVHVSFSKITPQTHAKFIRNTWVNFYIKIISQQSSSLYV